MEEPEAREGLVVEEEKTARLGAEEVGGDLAIVGKARRGKGEGWEEGRELEVSCAGEEAGSPASRESAAALDVIC